MRRATSIYPQEGQDAEISIHALREEGDTRICEDCGVVMEFLSTPSVRRATGAALLGYPIQQFLSTPSVRRATPFLLRDVVRRFISIHALREEGDFHSFCGM